MSLRQHCQWRLRRAASTVVLTAVLGCLVAAAAVAAPPDPCRALSAPSFAVEHA